MSIVEDAKVLLESGLSVIPIEEGTKKFKGVSWKTYQNELAKTANLKTLFASGDWLAVVCGAVSGHLEVMDFDIPNKDALPEGSEAHSPVFASFCKQLKESGHQALVKRLVAVQTRSGGMHLIYRCPSGIEGNQKLAVTKDRQVLIETRGEGGYFLTTPSPGYKLRQGQLAQVPELTAEERETLLSAARSFNEYFEEHRTGEKLNSRGVKPGEDFNARANWEDILGKHGWTQGGVSSGHRTAWIRPGKTKKQGIGATTGNGPEDLLWVHTSNAPPLEPNKSYSKFAAYTVLECGGDFFFAAQQLKTLGYGYQPQTEYRNGHATSNSPTLKELVDETESYIPLLRGTDIPRDKIPHLFKNRILEGLLTVIYGDPDQGKSTVTRALAAMITNGRGPAIWELERTEPGNVIWFSHEEPPSRIRDGFENNGGDQARLFVYSSLPDKGQDAPPMLFLDEDGITELEKMMRKIRPIITVFDTLEAFIPDKINMAVGNQMRAILGPFTALHSKYSVTPIVIAHTNKSETQNAINRLANSKAIIGAARAGFVVGPDPDDSDLRGVSHAKHNYTCEMPTIGFDIEDDGVIRWGQNVDLSANRILEPREKDKDRPKREACKEFLVKLLTNCAYQREAVLDRASEAGFSQALVYKAARLIPVQRSFEPSDGTVGTPKAWWALPKYDFVAHWKREDPFADPE